MRIGPDCAQPITDGPVAKPFERNGVALAVRELGVVLALTGEVGIDLDHVAHIDDQDERRPTVLLRQRAGIVFRLFLGGTHHPIPAASAASGGAGLDSSCVLGD